ncbi:serine protease [Leptospira levettii]|nr:serine protease [Leptospira levettii]
MRNPLLSRYRNRINERHILYFKILYNYMKFKIYVKRTFQLLFLCFHFQCSVNNTNLLPEPSMEIINEVKNRSVILHYNISDYAKGTGMLLDEEGHVITSRHVILGWEDRVRISQDSKTFYNAKVIAEEPKLDLVILKTELKNKLKKLTLVDRSELKTNQSIFLYGAPWGIGNSFLKGYISDTNRIGIDSSMPEVPFIQTVGTSYPGCSGAGVFLNDGSFIGINRATIGNEPGNSIGLVIPATFVKVMLKMRKFAL